MKVDYSPMYLHALKEIKMAHDALVSNKFQVAYEHCLNAGFSVDGQQYDHHRQPAHEYWANRLYQENFL
jgi:hypothetical protein